MPDLIACDGIRVGRRRQGLPRALHELAAAYAAGAGVRPSNASAARLYEAAARRGYAPAQCALVSYIYTI